MTLRALLVTNKRLRKRHGLHHRNTLKKISDQCLFCWHVHARNETFGSHQPFKCTLSALI